MRVSTLRILVVAAERASVLRFSNSRGEPKNLPLFLSLHRPPSYFEDANFWPRGPSEASQGPEVYFQSIFHSLSISAISCGLEPKLNWPQFEILGELSYSHGFEMAGKTSIESKFTHDNAFKMQSALRKVVFYHILIPPSCVLFFDRYRSRKRRPVHDRKVIFPFLPSEFFSHNSRHFRSSGPFKSTRVEQGAISVPPFVNVLLLLFRF